jgi:hypothetical protein
LNTVLLRLLFPAAAVGMAAFAAGQGWGLLNHWQVPFWLAVPVAVLVMDLVIWLQHVMVHAVPALWRLHRALLGEPLLGPSVGLPVDAGPTLDVGPEGTMGVLPETAPDRPGLDQGDLDA